MQDLHLAAVHEDGGHLVLADAEGGEYLLPIDERLRAVLRRPQPPAGHQPAAMSPRQAQAMIRAGMSAHEVAELTGWPEERVERFAGPVVAERGHVAEQARRAHVRGRSSAGGPATLEGRVRERLVARGVDTDSVQWDSSRPEGGGRWTVLLTFVAAQRTRGAAWAFDPVDRTVDALDDEARWLSEDEQALPGSATSASLLGGPGSHAGESVDLMTTMRERSRSRGRRRRPDTTVADPAHVPGTEDVPESVLPLEDLDYDPATMGLPPGARGDTSPSGAAAPGDLDVAGETGVAEDHEGGQGAGDDSAGGDLGGHEDDLSEDDLSADDLSAEDLDDEDTGPREATLADFFGPSDDDEDEEDAADEAEATDDEATGDGSPEGEGHEGEHPDGDGSGRRRGAPTGRAGSGRRVDRPATTVGEAREPSLRAPEGEEPDTPQPDTPQPDTLEGERSQQDPPEQQARPAGQAEPGGDEAAGSGGQDPGDPAEQDPPAPERPRQAGRKGRPSVPSWDDIMFGAKGPGR